LVENEEMGRLFYSAIVSLDGYIEDRDGSIDWGRPDEEVCAFVNDLERPVSTYLYGRRMYETMVYWETADRLADAPEVLQDFTRLWQAADKVVYSTTLQTTSSARTRIKRTFDPESVRQLKTSVDGDVTVAGANLAGQAIAAGLVDECQLFITPVVIGGGTPALPRGVRLELELLDERRFHSGVVFVRYRTR
jgi:dihydrofolate reductase